MMRAVLSTVAAAVLVLAWSVWSAWRVDELPAPRAVTVAGTLDRDDVSGDRYDLARVLAAVDKDPFRPSRRRPSIRFGVPSDASLAAATTAPSPSVRVIGTAVSQDGEDGFAMCALGTGAPRIVRIGERLGDWTLSKVMPGAAEFATASGSTIIVRIAKAGGGT